MPVRFLLLERVIASRPAFRAPRPARVRVQRDGVWRQGSAAKPELAADTLQGAARALATPGALNPGTTRCLPGTAVPQDLADGPILDALLETQVDFNQTLNLHLRPVPHWQSTPPLRSVPEPAATPPA